MNVMFNVAHELIKNMISQVIHIDLDKKIFFALYLTTIPWQKFNLVVGEMRKLAMVL